MTLSAVHHARGAMLHADATTDTSACVDHGIPASVDADGLLRANLHAHTAGHTSLLLALGYIFRFLTLHIVRFAVLPLQRYDILS